VGDLIVFQNNQTLIPEHMRMKILNILHAGRVGRDTMHKRAEISVFGRVYPLLLINFHTAKKIAFTILKFQQGIKSGKVRKIAIISQSDLKDEIA
jgi:hypothetical protein